MMSFDWLTILAAGSMTFVTPCILPLIPIYLAALAGGAVDSLPQAPRGTLLLRAALFCSGFIAVFVALGVAASSVSGVLMAHRATLQALGGSLVLLFACKYLGLIQVPLLDRVVRGQGGGQSPYAAVNAAVMGVVFGAGWSPCVGPILGAVLTYTASTTADPWRGAAYLAIYGVGLALPLLATAAAVGPALRALRRVRPYFGVLERITGAALLAVALWLTINATNATNATSATNATNTNSMSGVAAAPLARSAIASTPRMIELYSANCHICQEMMPVVQQVTRECQGGVEVQQLDVSAAENRALTSTYRLVGVPTFVFLDGEGKEVARLIGRQSPDSLRQALAALRGEACPGVGPLPVTPLLPQEPAQSCNINKADSCG